MRKKRLSEILTIIRENEIENQDMLLGLLKKRGYEVTQATVSRDISYLRLEKDVSAAGVNRYVERGSGGGALINEKKLFTQAVRRVDYAMNTVVLKCEPGWAGAVCAAFEKMNYPLSVGTIAGDDTVFILMRTENDAKALFTELLDLM
jgi:transcriptional regulator of arginine metabolism